MRVDEAWQQRRVTQIDDRRAGGDRDVGARRGDPSAFHDDDAVGHGCVMDAIEQPSCTNSGDGQRWRCLSENRDAQDRREEK